VSRLRTQSKNEALIALNTRHCLSKGSIKQITLCVCVCLCVLVWLLCVAPAEFSVIRGHRAPQCAGIWWLLTP
jgi:hypothetical protein